MATNTKKTTKPKNPLIGSQTKPVTLDSTTKSDIDLNKTLIDNILDAGLASKLDISALDRFTSISNTRDQVYQLIDTMCQDAAVTSVVRLYAEDATEFADNGHIIWCESPDTDISKFVNYLLNVINADKHMFQWTYNLIKYGDVYLRLFRESDYEDRLFNSDNINKANDARTPLNEGVNLVIHHDSDPYSYYVEMVADPSTMFELTRHGQTFGYIEVPNEAMPFDQSTLIGGAAASGLATGNTIFNFKYKSNDVNVFQADDFVHASLDDVNTRYPETVELFYEDSSDPEYIKKYGTNATAQAYQVKRGKSMLYDVYKIWREKSLLEAAILLSRVTRSGLVRKVAVEVGDMSKEQTKQVIRRVKELFEQKSAYNSGDSFSEYTNPGAVENFIYYATHNGQGAISVDSVGGDYDPKTLTDLDWWNHKFYSAFGIPPAYLGWTQDSAGFNGGSSLTIISSIYAKGVKRIQNAMIQAITELINLILLNKGCKSYINNFILKMRTPISQEEKDFREGLGQKVQAISNIIGLLNDVEDKSRRLTIIKNLINTLHLGDEISEEIQKEIEAAEEAKKKEEEAAAAENAKTGEETSNTEEPPTLTDADFDLGTGKVTENLDNDNKTILTEEQIFTEADDDLPTPEEANEEIDFTENN